MYRLTFPLICERIGCSFNKVTAAPVETARTPEIVDQLIILIRKIYHNFKSIDEIYKPKFA